jgi:hypothetical protein
MSLLRERVERSSAATDVVVARVRYIFAGTFARLGYARVPEPTGARTNRSLLVHEVTRLIARNETTLTNATTRPELARALSEVFAAAKAKVARDEVWAERYAAEGNTETIDLIRQSENILPRDWSDL